MIHRRVVLTGAACAGLSMVASGKASAIPSLPDRIAFDVIRKDSVIGTHVVNFEPTGNDLLVRIDVRLAVGLGPITLFRYHHQAIERWRGTEFVGIETTTDNNGEALRVSARRVGDRLQIESSKLGRQTMPGRALPLTHWNIECMSAPLFNPQDGKPMEGPVTPRGADTITLADGRRVPGRRFSMAGEAPLDDWYDDTQTWTRLRATAKDGSVVDYRRIA